MTALRGSDLKQTLDFLEEAASVTGGDPFPAPVLGSLRRVIPSAAAAWHEWSVTGRRYRCTISSDAADRTSEVWQAYPLYRSEDPFPGGAPGAAAPPTHFVGRALRLSDLVGRRAFRRTGLYGNICRPLGVDDVMKLYLPVRDGVARCLVLDASGRDFSDRDRRLLDVLFPYVRHFDDSARVRRLAGAVVRRDDEWDDVLTPREREILALVEEGQSNREIATALCIAPATVRTHLEHVYAKLGVHTRTAAVTRLRRPR